MAIENAAKLKKLTYLIHELQQENPGFYDGELPDNEEEAFQLFRALCNIRRPGMVSDEFINVQDEVLQAKTAEKGITDVNDLKPSKLDDRLYLWQGDITTLRCDAIVNAANSQMLGCFHPLHNCIDNIIHTMAGVQLRNECYHQMAQLRKQKGQHFEMPTAEPLITPGYNLPAKKVIHIVGPIIRGPLTKRDKDLLAKCYEESLQLAACNQLTSIAFCCISTGVFMFPQDEAAKIAVKTVKQYLAAHPEGTVQQVIFNVFKASDFTIYQSLLGK